MKRFRRWMLNGVAALSLLLFSICAIQWVRSYSRINGFGFSKRDWLQSDIFHARNFDVRNVQGYWLLSTDDQTIYIGNLVILKELRTSSHNINTYWNADFAEQFRQENPTGLRPVYYSWDISHQDPEELKRYGPTDYLMGVPRTYGFGYLYSRPPTPVPGKLADTARSSVQIIFPIWTSLIVFSILPLVWCGHYYRVCRRKKMGHCSLCGYDLRATPNECPECGTVPKKGET